MGVSQGLSLSWVGDRFSLVQVQSQMLGSVLHPWRTWPSAPGGVPPCRPGCGHLGCTATGAGGRGQGIRAGCGHPNVFRGSRRGCSFGPGLCVRLRSGVPQQAGGRVPGQTAPGRTERDDGEEEHAAGCAVSAQTSLGGLTARTRRLRGQQGPRRSRRVN